MPRGVPKKPRANKKVLTSVQAEVEPLLQLPNELEQQQQPIELEIPVAPVVVTQQFPVFFEGYIGPVGLNRSTDDGTLLCQYPLCNDVVFIWDSDLQLSLCDAHSLVTPSQIKIASTQNPNSIKYKSSSRTIKHFFSSNTSTNEVLTKTKEISDDMELSCNRKRASNKGNDSLIETVSTVTVTEDSDCLETKRPKKERYVGSLVYQNQCINNLIKKNPDDNGAKVFNSSKSGILCSTCGSNPIPANMLLQHYNTEKHKNKMVAFLKNKLVNVLLENSNAEKLVPMKFKSFRYDITKMFMITSVPLHKVIQWRPTLEKYSGCLLTDKSHLRKTYIPIIYKEEKDKVKAFAVNKLWSMIFDGTSKWGENFVIILRAVVDFEPRQILAKLGRYKRSFKEKGGRFELSSAIITTTIGDLQLDAGKCVAKHCDCASVNFHCLNSIPMGVFVNGENVGCFSHTLAHCGEQVELACEFLDDFMILINGTFCRSSNAKGSLEAYIPGASVLDYSKTRWFAKRDAMKWILENFHTLTEWFRLSDNDFETSLNTQYRKLRKLLLFEVEGHDPSILFYIKFELAIVVDVTGPYHKACYNLEGDGPLAMVAFEQIETVFHILESSMDMMSSYHNVQAIIREVCVIINDPNEKVVKQTELITYARERMLNGYTYFMSHFWEDNAKRQSNLQLFKIYRILNPKHVKSLGAAFTGAYVRTQLQKLIDDERWEHLLSERQLLQIIEQTPEYKRLCFNEDFEDMDYKDTLKRIVSFWKRHVSLYAWWILVEPAYLTQPSSCAAERALSVFTRIMTENMKHALIDLIEGSMMLNINNNNDIDELDE